MAFISENLKDLISTKVKELGYMLWGIELIPQRYSTLVRVYIDSEERTPLGVEDCASVNRTLDDCLKEENIVLEVSTPGLARKFFSAQQYASYIGSKVRIKTKKLIGGRKNFIGELVAVDAKSLQLKEDGEKASTTKEESAHHPVVRDFLHLDIANIATGRLEPDYKEIFKK